MIDKIIGFASLPVSIVLFLNLFGILGMDAVVGIDLLLIAAVTHVILQVANVISSHITDEYVVLSYVIHGILLFPSVIYFLSLVITLPDVVTAPLLPIFASFIFMEGIYSFFI